VNSQPSGGGEEPGSTRKNPKILTNTEEKRKGERSLFLFFTGREGIGGKGGSPFS